MNNVETPIFNRAPHNDCKPLCIELRSLRRRWQNIDGFLPLFRRLQRGGFVAVRFVNEGTALRQWDWPNIPSHASSHVKGWGQSRRKKDDAHFRDTGIGINATLGPVDDSDVSASGFFVAGFSPSVGSISSVGSFFGGIGGFLAGSRRPFHLTSLVGSDTRIDEGSGKRETRSIAYLFLNGVIPLMLAILLTFRLVGEADFGFNCLWWICSFLAFSAGTYGTAVLIDAFS